MYNILDFICILILTLISLKELQRDKSTSPQSPDGLQILVIMTLLSGQGRDLVVPVAALSQERNPVFSGGHQGSLTRVCKVFCCPPSTEDIIPKVGTSREGEGDFF